MERHTVDWHGCFVGYQECSCHKWRMDVRHADIGDVLNSHSQHVREFGADVLRNDRMVIADQAYQIAVLEGLDRPDFKAVFDAWNDVGVVPGYHRTMQAVVRQSMPLLGRALDRLTLEVD